MIISIIVAESKLGFDVDEIFGGKISKLKKQPFQKKRKKKLGRFIVLD